MHWAAFAIPLIVFTATSSSFMRFPFLLKMPRWTLPKAPGKNVERKRSVLSGLFHLAVEWTQLRKYKLPSPIFSWISKWGLGIRRLRSVSLTLGVKTRASKQPNSIFSVLKYTNESEQTHKKHVRWIQNTERERERERDRDREHVKYSCMCLFASAPPKEYPYCCFHCQEAALKKSRKECKAHSTLPSRW